MNTSAMSNAANVFRVIVLKYFMVSSLVAGASWSSRFRYSRNYRSTCVFEISARDALNVFLRHAVIFVLSFVDEISVTVEQGVLTERNRASQSALKLLRALTTNHHADFLQLPVGNGFVLQPIKLRINQLLDVGEVLSGRSNRCDLKK